MQARVEAASCDMKRDHSNGSSSISELPIFSCVEDSSKWMQSVSSFSISQSPDMRPLILLECGTFSPPTLLHSRLMEDARDCARAVLKGHVVIGGLLSPVHASYKFKQKTSNILDQVVDAPIRYAMVFFPSKVSFLVTTSTHSTKVLISTLLGNLAKALVEEPSCSKEVTAVHFAVRERLASMMNLIVPDCAPSLSSWSLENVDVALCCGSDLLASMAMPGVWDQKLLAELLSEFYVIVIPRVGSDTARCVEDDELLRKHRDRIVIASFGSDIDVQPSALSSTMVRRYVAAGRSIKYFVADEVLDIIETEQLFRDGDMQSSSY